MLSVYRDRGVVVKDEALNPNKTAEDRSIYQLVEPGWLVVNRMKAWQGSVGIADVRGIVSGHYICFRPTHDENHRYLHYLLRSPVFTARFAAISRGVRPGQIEIDNDELAATKLSLPLLEDQKRIADFLDDQVTRIDHIIAARKSQAVAATDERRSVVHVHISATAVEGDRRTSSLPWIDSLPTSWGEPRICEVARMGTGHTPSRSREELWVNPTIPWLTTGDVHRFRADQIDRIEDTMLHITPLGLDDSSAVIHPAGTVALSRTASAGFSIVMGKPMATSQDYATWTPGSQLISEFLLWCLRDMRGDLMGRLAVGSTHKTIYFPDLMSIRVPLPPIADQHSAVSLINAAVDRETQLLSGIGRSVALLGELKRSLTTAAVTGEIDVSSADGSQVPVA